MRNYIDRVYDHGADALVTDGSLDPLDELFTIARKTWRLIENLVLANSARSLATSVNTA